MNLHVHRTLWLVLVVLCSWGCHGGPGLDNGDGGTEVGDGGAAAAMMNCPGYKVFPGALVCRTQKDCGGGILQCLAPGAPRGCGIQRQCEHQCETDRDCTQPGKPVCVPTNMPCCSRPGTQCQARCTVDSCTPNEETCVASGHCEPTPCKLGYTCPRSASCSPGVEGADAHGCLRRPCTRDSECDCGACVLSVCQDGPGLCTPPAA